MMMSYRMMVAMETTRSIDILAEVKALVIDKIKRVGERKE